MAGRTNRREPPRAARPHTPEEVVAEANALNDRREAALIAGFADDLRHCLGMAPDPGTIAERHALTVGDITFATEMDTNSNRDLHRLILIRRLPCGHSVQVAAWPDAVEDNMRRLAALVATQVCRACEAEGADARAIDRLAAALQRRMDPSHRE